MAEILIPCIVGASLLTLTFYLCVCIYDRRNPIKFWHDHNWVEVYHRAVVARYGGDPYNEPPSRKTLVIVNQCTICKRTRKTEDSIF